MPVAGTIVTLQLQIAVALGVQTAIAHTIKMNKNDFNIDAFTTSKEQLNDI